MQIKEEIKKQGVQQTFKLLEETQRLDDLYMYFSGIYVKPKGGIGKNDLHTLFLNAGCGFLLRCLEDSFETPSGNLIIDDILEIYYTKNLKI